MIMHIVMWQLKDHAEGADKAHSLQKMKALLESCKALVQGIVRLDVAVAQPGLEATCDIIMISEFESLEALDAYQSHPHHVAMKPFIGAIRQTRHCMDFQT